jgi:hypothetical protein
MVSMDPEAIYRNFTSEAHGTGGLAAARDTVVELGRGAVENAESVRGMSNSIAAGWTGAAADDAGQALTPLVRDLTGFATELETTQDLIARQVDSFHATANRVTPMPPRPVLPDVAGMVVAGENPTSMLDQVHGYQAAANNNVDAMTSYQNDSAYNAENLPPMNPELATTLPADASAIPRITITAAPKPTTARNSAASRHSSPRSSTSMAPRATTPGSGSVSASATGSGTATGPGPTTGTAPGISPMSGTDPVSDADPASDTGPLPDTDPASGTTTAMASAAPSSPAPSAAPSSAAALAVRHAAGRVDVVTSPLTTAQGIPATEQPVENVAPRTSGVGETESAEAAGGRQRGGSGGSVPMGGIAGQSAGTGGDTEHRRKYEYGEGADKLFLGGLPEGASSILDADPAE